ncbi:MAG: hypothetical protein KatS3mg015_3215 [Fimbriimonadales bacterium]|nr:MAG: hypothetical protein KatS3mg015_3215 [Fimbriimonadales bacterium]
MEETLVVKVVPKGEHARIDALAFTASHLHSILGSIDTAILLSFGKAALRASNKPRRPPEREWLIRSAHASTLTLTLTANGVLPGEAPATSAVFIEGMRRLSSPAPRPPEYISEASLRSIQALSKGLHKKAIEVIEIGRRDFSRGEAETSIDSSTHERVGRVFSEGYSELNFVEGLLDTVALRRNKRQLRIVETFSRRVVYCEGVRDEMLFQRAKDALGEHVRVHGMIAYFSDGTPRRVLEVEDFEVRRMPERQGPDLYGSLRDVRGIEDPVAAIARLRGEVE